MDKEELLRKVKKIKNNLENAKKQLQYAKNILDDSITFNNVGFKSNEINNISKKMTTQINNLNNKIIPGIDV